MMDKDSKLALVAVVVASLIVVGLIIFYPPATTATSQNSAIRPTAIPVYQLGATDPPLVSPVPTFAAN
jgi:hypothetical protein